MNILKSIGGLFIRLWRWIKETAWVQPLLIVGAIFAVIFSIPKFTEWVNAIQVQAASRYWADYKHTMNNEVESTKVYGTAADKITEAIHEWSNLDDEYETYDEWVAGMTAKLNSKSLNVNVDPRKEYGEKFFLVYVGEDCSSCDAIQPAFEALSENWNTMFHIEDKVPFKLHTIYTDEESDNDDDYDLDEYKKSFVRYLDKFEDNNFLPDAGRRLREAPYKKNNSVGDSNYDNFEKGDHSGFATPTILLVDFTKEAFNLELSRVGVSEVLFGVSGSGKYEKAAVLADMWNHTNSDTANKFSDNYNSAK